MRTSRPSSLSHGPQRDLGGIAHRNDPLLGALAPDGHADGESRSRSPSRERAELGDPQARCRRAARERRRRDDGWQGRVDPPTGRRRGPERRFVEQDVQLVLTQDVRQAGVAGRGGETDGRIGWPGHRRGRARRSTGAAPTPCGRWSDGHSAASPGGRDSGGASCGRPRRDRARASRAAHATKCVEVAPVGLDRRRSSGSERLGERVAAPSSRPGSLRDARLPRPCDSRTTTTLAAVARVHAVRMPRAVLRGSAAYPGIEPAELSHRSSPSARATRRSGRRTRPPRASATCAASGARPSPRAHGELSRT